MAERLRTRIEEVTTRQLEVARLLAEGRTNPEIATALGITLDGAKYHVSELLGRLGLDRREDVAEWYRTERRGQRSRRLSALFATAPRAFLAAAGATAVIAVGVLFVVALDGGRADDPVATAATATPSPSPVVEVGAVPALGATGDASDLPQDLQALPFMLGQRLQSPAPTVVSWERIDWFDGCFELPPTGGCPMSVSPVPGYRVVMDLDGEEYIARTDIGAGRYALEAAPPVPPFDMAFQWTGTHSEAGFLCLDLQLAADGRGSIASCGEAPTAVDLGQSGVGSVATLDYLRSKASYEVPDAAGSIHGRLVVRGTANEAPGSLPWAADRWGRYAAIEAYTGHSSASMALAIGWRDDNAEGCTDVQVEQYGVAFFSGCPEGGDGAIYFDNERLQRLIEWLDAYAPFEVPGDSTYLIFSGSGPDNAPEAVRAEIRDWVAALAAEGASALTAAE